MKTATRKKTTAKAGDAALRAVQLPPLGAEWPGEGGIFVGIRKLDGKDVAVIVPTESASDIAAAAWKDAITKAAAFKTKQHQDFVAADRVDLYLAYTHAPQLFKKDWYWSSTPYAGTDDYAWFQSFNHGTQNVFHKSYRYRARAVRRLIIQ